MIPHTEIGEAEMGQSVPEGFTLPCNTTVTMADVWGVKPQQVVEPTPPVPSPDPMKGVVARRDKKTAAAVQARALAKSGKLRFAGYDATDYWNGK